MSSTFRDLKDERRQILDDLKEALIGVGMERFIPDGTDSHNKCIEELKKCDAAIFLISTWYGSSIKECKLEGCKADCPMKESRRKISYTHCEYKTSLAEDKPHQTYLVYGGWDEVNTRSRLGEFKTEVEREFSPRIEEVGRIKSDLAENIVKWYSQGKIDLMDFRGRRKDLKELIEKMDESVEVYGVGGVGKTSLIHVALLIQKLRGKKIISIGTSQSYRSGSGYKHFLKRYDDGFKEVVGDRIVLDDIIDALSIDEDAKILDRRAKIELILDRMAEENIYIFIDDFHLADDDVQDLVKKIRGGVVLASKRRVGLARAEHHLFGIDEDERDDFIDYLISKEKFDKRITDEARRIIKDVAEGHPVSTEILIKNYDKINFSRIETYKQSLKMSDPRDAEEFLKRVVKEILSDGAFELLRSLSAINPDLGSNIDLDAIQEIFPEKFNERFFELVDSGMLEKKEGFEDAYIFSYKHIQEALNDDGRVVHESAVNYYKNKSKGSDPSPDDDVERLFHASKLDPKKELVKTYLELAQHLKPVNFGFTRLIIVGEHLKEFLEAEDKVPLLVAMGNLYSDLRRFEDAEEAYKEALEIYRELAEKRPDAYLPYLATTQNNLAVLYSNLRRFEDAEEAYKEALEIYRELAEKNPDAYLPDLAMTQNNLGNLYRALRRFEDAESAYKVALEIFRDLADRRPDAYSPYLAGTQNNLAILYSDLRRFEDAEEAYKEALEIYRELADRRPDAYLPYLATTQNNLAVLYSNLRRFEDAESAYKEALEIYGDLADRRPDAYLPDLATTQNNLGNLYRALRRFEDAESAYKEALEIRRDLAEKSPDAYLPDLATTQNNLGILYRALRRFEDAEEAYKEALKIYRDLAEKRPDAYLPDLAMTKANIGLFYIETDRIGEGIEVLEDCLRNKDALPDFGARCFAGLGSAYEALEDRYRGSQNYLFASAANFLMFKHGIPCLNDVIGFIQKVMELGDGDVAGDASMMKTAIMTLAGEDAEIPDVPLSHRGEVLRDALSGKDAELNPRDEVDLMALILAKDLLS